MPGKSVTIRDVSKLADVSVGTISNYLNATKGISPPTTARIEKAIRESGFVPNMAVRVMKGHRSPTVALVVPDLGNPFFSEVAKGIEDVVAPAGLVVIACNAGGIAEREHAYLKTLGELRVTGALITPTFVSDGEISALASTGAAVVLLDERRPHLNLSSVTVNDFEGGRLVVEHLLKSGHRRITFVGGPAADLQVQNRYLGARQAIAEAGLEADVLNRIDTEGTDVASRSRTGDDIAQMPNRPTALFCANDMIALAIQGALGSRGLRVPEDVAIVGYDDIDQARLGSVPLTTVRQPQYELGRIAAELMLKEAKLGESSVENINFQPELVIRTSA